MSAPCLPVKNGSRSKKRRRNMDADETLSGDDERMSSHDEGGTEGFEDIATMDASEYLLRVVNEAKKLPEIFVAEASASASNTLPEKHRQHIPIDGSAASLKYLLSGRASLKVAPSKDYLPADTKEWIERVLINFESLRTYLESCREKGVGGKLTKRVAFPPMKDREGWHLFCVGAEEAAGNVNSYYGDDYEQKSGTVDETDGKSETPLPEWRQDIPSEGQPPSVTLICQMDQVLVRRILSHICYYISQGWQLSAQRVSWIYALLARLEKPVHRDDASTLFGLLKVLTMMRSTLDISASGSGNDLSRLNMLITLVGIYFEQGAKTVMSLPLEPE